MTVLSQTTKYRFNYLYHDVPGNSPCPEHISSMKRSRESLYQMRYYRKKTMDALRNENKRLKERINLILDSQEGKEYKRRKAREYYREYREKNKDKIREYQREYAKI